MCADYEPALPTDLVAHPGDSGGDRDLLRAGRLCPLVRLRAFLGRGGDRLARWAHGATLLWTAAILTLVTGYDYLRAGLRHMARPRAAPASRESEHLA